jgi:hypothetical protein
MVLLVLLPGETRPTWAYPAHYTPALASSALSMLRLLTRLAVRSAWREPGEPAAFPCSTTIPSGRFRSALYTGSATFASGQNAAPEPDCLPLWFKPCTVSCGLFGFTMLASVYLVLTVSSHSSAAPRETGGLAALSGRLQTRRRIAFRACSPGIPVAKHRAYSGTVHISNDCCVFMSRAFVAEKLFQRLKTPWHRLCYGWRVRFQFMGS